VKTLHKQHIVAIFLQSTASDVVVEGREFAVTYQIINTGNAAASKIEVFDRYDPLRSVVQHSVVSAYVTQSVFICLYTLFVWFIALSRATTSMRKAMLSSSWKSWLQVTCLFPLCLPLPFALSLKNFTVDPYTIF